MASTAAWTQINFFSSSISCGEKNCQEVSKHLLTDLDPRRIHGITNIPNTWGFHNKINGFSFEDYSEKQKLSGCSHGVKLHNVTWNVSSEDRKTLKKIIDISTSILDGLGYAPGISVMSGLVRIITAIFIRCVALTLVAQGQIAGRFKDEVEWTCNGHVIRGIIEMIPVIGQLINLGCDLSYCNYHRFSYLNPAVAVSGA